MTHQVSSRPRKKDVIRTQCRIYKGMGPLLKCEAVFYILIGDRKKKTNPKRVHNELRFPIEVVCALLDNQYPESFSREKHCLLSSGSGTGSIIKCLNFFLPKYLQSNRLLSPASRNKSQNSERLLTHCLPVKCPYHLVSTLTSHTRSTTGWWSRLLDKIKIVSKKST